jgi:hypothetical protein
MKCFLRAHSWLSVILMALLFTTGLVLADPPEGKGKGAAKGHERREGAEQQARARLSPGAGVYFVDRHRVEVRTYYGDEHRRGHCPPGLAKKHNGCMPPGQAKTWHVGSPLPRDVVIYDLPPALVVKIGTPPVGHKYVRVAADILLIAVGTSMVVDAIQDLGGM